MTQTKEQLTNQQKMDSLLNFLGEMKPIVAEIEQTLSSISALRQNIKEDIAEALKEQPAPLAQDHQHGGDANCPGCMGAAQNAMTREYDRGMAEMKAYLFGLNPDIEQKCNLYETMKAEVDEAKAKGEEIVTFTGF